METIQIVVVGASAGGVDPLARLAELLPGNSPAAFFIATHRATPHSLKEILQDKSRLPVEVAQEAAKIEPGRLYVCPADYNLSLEYGRLRVERSPKEVV